MTRFSGGSHITALKKCKAIFCNYPTEFGQYPKLSDESSGDVNGANEEPGATPDCILQEGTS
jgi:hypothetical protein